MTEIPTCPTCGRVPSARWGLRAGTHSVREMCGNPVHDAADLDPALKTERDEARALVFELFRHGCLVVDKDASASRSVYDHMASATLREAQAALIAWGMVKREECVRE